MAPNISGDRFISYKIPAWHMLGKVFDTKITATEGLVLADAVYNINKVPVLAQIGNNEYVEIDGQYSLIREPMHDMPCHEHFGFVGNDYEYLQNTEIAMVCDQLISTGNWTLETIGVLGKGETIFVVMSAGDTEIAGENVKKHFMYTSTRDGKGADILNASYTRTVCSNTLSLALRNSLGQVKMRHGRNMLLEASWRMEVVRQATAAGHSMEVALKGLAALQINEEMFNDVLARLFPAPKMPATLDLAVSGVQQLTEKAERAKYHHEWRIEQVKKAQATVAENFTRLNDEYPSIAGTAWSAYNAVTEWVDHQSGKNAEVRKRESLFGKGQQVRDMAYTMLVETAQSTPVSKVSKGKRK